jgi:isoleucyl-tRNA synthetase
MHFSILARQFASQTLEKQKKDFQSWGILADWHHCYQTFDKTYIIDQIRLFWQLYKKVRMKRVQRLFVIDMSIGSTLSAIQANQLVATYSISTS